jgi:adenosylcobinamide-GDP ribazoletransferase
MSAEWRLFLLALRYFTRIPVPAGVLRGAAPFNDAARYLPLVGIVVGAGGGALYWLAALVWPTSLAVLLSMLGVVLLTGAMHEQGLAATCAVLGDTQRRERALQAGDSGQRSGFGALGLLFVQLIRYDALLGLSSAQLPFALPAHVGLGLTMVAGHAASRALVVSAITHRSAARITTGAMTFALLCGFLPATLLGTAGMVGLAAAIVVRMGFVHAVGARLGEQPGDLLGATQQLTEVAFYLGALATWTYI